MRPITTQFQPLRPHSSTTNDVHVDGTDCAVSSFSFHYIRPRQSSGDSWRFLGILGDSWGHVRPKEEEEEEGEEEELILSLDVERCC